MISLNNGNELITFYFKVLITCFYLYTYLIIDIKVTYILGEIQEKNENKRENIR